MSTHHSFTIAGAGPVGLSMALLLQKTGQKVTLFEKRPDPRIHPERGRSINLALSDRGFRTLALLGLENSIKQTAAIPMQGRMIHTESGQTNLQPYSQDGKTIFSVSRSTLNNLLLDEAEKRGIRIQFEHKLHQVDLTAKEIQFEGKDPASYTTLLACDGAFSAVRNAFKSLPDFSCQETVLDYAYKELTIPSQNGSFAFEKNALHIWPRKSFMLIALPNLDGSFTCTLFLKEKGENSFESLEPVSEARSFFTQHFLDALDRMPDFEEEWKTNPVSRLYMETCHPWNERENVLLLGDAAHAIVPFYGQGLNAGLEDCRILHEYLQMEPSQALNKFQFARQKDTEAIGQLALKNFIEMRDLVTDEQFLLKSKLESKLKKWYPEKWLTQYEMVTFSQLPYSTAQAKGQENQRKLDLILENEILTEHLLQDAPTEQDMYLLSLIVL
jgi:kynurenine 3-monooxygenase